MSSSSSSSIRIPSLLPEPSSSGVNEKSSFICKACGKGFQRSYGLERHALTHDENRAALEIKCPFEGCGFSALQKSNVKNHYASVHEKKKHICTQPRVTFGSPYDAHGSPVQCGQLFSDQSALIRHEKNAHSYYRRQAKEAGLQPSSGATYHSSVRATDGDTIGRPRTAAGMREGSVDLKFMPPLTYDPNAVTIPGAPLPSEKKVQSWLRSVDGRTAGARSSAAMQMGGAGMMMDVEMSGSHPHSGYVSTSAAAYAPQSHSHANGYAHPHLQQQHQQQQAYYNPSHSPIGTHHHSQSQPQVFSRYSPTQAHMHPVVSQSSPQSQSHSDSDSASLQTTSSHSYSGSSYPSIPMAPGVYSYQSQPSDHKAGVETFDCYDYLYPREDLRTSARAQGGYVRSLDML